jgi:hypothetical protein
MVHVTLKETSCQISVDSVVYKNYDVTKHILRDILTSFSKTNFTLLRSYQMTPG